MSSDSFYIKQGDRLPNFRVRLKDAESNYIDLTDATVAGVTFSMAPRTNHGNPKVSGEDASIGFTAGDGTVYDGSDGHVEYQWAAGDTDTVGEYDSEFIITYTDGKTQTCPSNGYKRIRIGNDL